MFKAWLCTGCSKFEVSRGQPDWVEETSSGHFGHWIWQEKMHKDWDFGGIVFCGTVQFTCKKEY